MRIRGHLTIAFATICLAGAVLVPSQAGASTASISVNNVYFFATAGETNDVTVEKTGTAYVLSDPGSTIVPGAGCTAVTANVVSCSTAGITNVDLRLGDLNDKARIADSVRDLGSNFGQGVFIQGDAGDDTLSGGKFVPNTLYGHTDFFADAPGDDELTGGDLSDTLRGGGGQDVLTGGPDRDNLRGDTGNDIENGGAGDDRIDEGEFSNGADVLTGGTGTDQISYADRRAAVKISQNGASDDGETGEGDNVSSQFLLVTGGSGNDTITGSAGGAVYSGEDGNDTVSGGGGNDVVEGGDGNDTLKGEDGSDLVNGGRGDDQLDGGAGDDALLDGGESGETGSDRFAGGSGIDLLDYSTEEPLSIDLDGVADDGRSGENDNAGADLEDLRGGPQGDVLVGNDSANQIEGGGGSDRIDGRGGDDGLSGGNGDDRIDGGAGVDEIDGAEGFDTLRSRDSSADEVDCGSGADTLLADSLDDFSVACDQASTGARLSATSARMKNGKASLKVSCPAVEGTDCNMKVTADKGGKVMVRGAGEVEPGMTGTVRVKLTKAGKRKK